MDIDMNQKLLDLKAQQTVGELIYCPRCGRESMDPVLLRNALSRYADLHICPDCGTAEAMLDMMNNPMPLHEWATFKNRHAVYDLKALSMAEVIGRVVNKHIPILSRIHTDWIGQRHGSDFTPFYQQAMNACPGLLDLRASPFCAVYQAKDGQVLVRFRCSMGKTDIAVDTLPASK